MFRILASLPFLFFAFSMRIVGLYGGTCFFVDVIDWGPACFGKAFFVPWAIRFAALFFGIALLFKGIKQVRAQRSAQSPPQ